MASIRSRYNKLVVDFRYMNKRCRETTNLIDTPANRKKLEKVIEKMEAEIILGLFNYAKYFPKSDKAAQMVALNDRKECISTDTPSFEQFAKLWFSEKEIEWRDTYKRKIKEIIDMYLI
ncbi:MAG: Arm DNA-binding domain-containing protein, partial [Psychrobacter celer]